MSTTSLPEPERPTREKARRYLKQFREGWELHVTALREGNPELAARAALKTQEADRLRAEI
ncbi:MAG: hypothetical protein NT069_05170 [Planctomycetota bacterium]|nr:hypothetical protein [Planctomycetota bacterium]